MAGKSKFQILRILDERIKQIAKDVKEYEPEFDQISQAYILGFHCSNVTNYVGLTTSYQHHNSGYPVVGLAFFKATPKEDEIQSEIESLKRFFSSVDGLGSFKQDINEHLFLIYHVDEDTKQMSKRLFNSSDGSFLEVQPKLVVLDEAKIFNHSPITKLSLCLKLDILAKENCLQSEDKLMSTLDDVKGCFSSDSAGIRIHLLNSSFSTSSASSNKNPTETLYNYLDPPNDIYDMGDYLPQMTKKDKEKLVEKWHNKMKSQRSPLEFRLEHDDLSVNEDSKSSNPNSLVVPIEMFLHINVNDPVSKTIQIVLLLLRQKIESIRSILTGRGGKTVEQGELKSCTFNPHIGHLIQGFYLVPSNSEPNFKQLSELRREMHLAYLVPLTKPEFRYSQRLLDVNLRNADEQAGYLCNVHTNILESSGIKGGLKSVVRGTYTYHHYNQDRISDNGWGCAYRSLQTIISWFKLQGYIYSPDVELRAPKGCSNDKTNALRKKLHVESRVPTHEEIQAVLVDIGDKQASFIGSQKWIGSQEVCYVLNHLYNLDCKFISVSGGGELVYKARELCQHFGSQSTPVMIGGGVLAHTIIGVDFNEKNGDISYLILDPHYTGAEDLAVITKKGWCGWKKNSFWDKNAFYNLCLPQIPVEF